VSMPDCYDVMRTRRRAYDTGARPPGPMFWETSYRLVLPGYQPHEIARMAKEVRRRIQRWRERRIGASA
jgi:hypothetical protein